MATTTTTETQMQTGSKQSADAQRKIVGADPDGLESRLVGRLSCRQRPLWRIPRERDCKLELDGTILGRWDTRTTRAPAADQQPADARSA